MNKQLINKYKHEFDHWLNEGKILYKHIHSDVWYNEDPWDYSPDYIIAIIINDEYSKFRKALSEGKTIQIYDVIEQHISDRTFDKFGWRDFKSFTASSSFSKTPDLYRIKPDEPKFKVGDFVRCTCTTSDASPLRITKFVQGNYHVANSNLSFLGHELELWTPVKGEWCWFFNDDRIPTISQFVEVDDNITRKYFAVYPNRPKALGSWYKKCEPFLNSLPSYLKDK